MSNNRTGIRFLHCSFCGKSQLRPNSIIAGQGRVSVCYECVRVFGQIIAEERPGTPPAPDRFHPRVPREIYANLESYVIGQERAKKTLSVAVYNHFKRILQSSEPSGVELQKSNILIIGPTGCGKTLLAQTLAKALDVPFAISDATSLTESGYVGEDVENILLRLIQAADWDISRAEQGIVYIDELDKIARKEGVNRSITRDVSGEGVQQELLKIVEGCIASVPPQGGRKHPQQEFIQINTKNILFICGGSFEGLAEIVSKRLSAGGPRMGFLTQNNGHKEADGRIVQHVSPQDLLDYGFIPELVGRLPLIVTLDPLDRDSLVRVLTEPRNAIIKQYQHLFSLDDIRLEFTGEALTAAAERALKHQTGARSLRYIIEETLIDVMYELPSLKKAARCVVDRDAIQGEGLPMVLTAAGEPLAIPLGRVQRSA